MTDLGKYIFFGGLLVTAIGAGLWLAGRFGLPLGRLPVDLSWQGERTSVYFPVVTCIVISVVLTVVLNLLGRWMR